MDPDATLRDLLEAILKRNWHLVDELQDSLLTWMERGGFPPSTIGSKELGTEWHRSIATFVCHAAASKARDAGKRRARKRKDELS